ncbi:hypothetical protein GF325_17885 [Candidatus Bathyarchaeota archaeon]|nr:hypothetical protein [Candidatus Bathyarchaeota archaeon]
MNYWREERETYYKEHGNPTGFKYTTAKMLKDTRPWLKKPDNIALQ